MNIKVRPRLQMILDKKGWSQSELSRRSGVTQATISRFDSAERHYDRHVFAIARALGVNVEDLFEVTTEDAN
ncbi:MULTISPECIES: helix-turn-helix domain-containing protein [Bacillus]|uniref:helix-turn-helix domain-containing protein n=2 Tax=Bacillus TaxID=1386 RepID=UPI0003EDA0D6|nr:MULTISPECIES: helix-turn-helix transcriptional regulator [Bacillus]KUL16220.1 transcriptional regulator [Bacillus licheniformis LMG 6934]EWH19779.1 transcriptional regulator [Bacillus haynesii]MCY8438143.1 helix-turn-helix transcriptional regulator [Bacillus haynesii]MEC0552348.1 helix-turn-helix transcriptional regulator [Bacillus haynesii]MEC0633373.1 helix-turn-helix transcriptional regulator [Bacillus haynesii]